MPLELCNLSFNYIIACGVEKRGGNIQLESYLRACMLAVVPITSSNMTPKMPPCAVFAKPLIPLPKSSRQHSCRNGFFLSSPVSLAGAVGLMYRRNVTHAFTVDGVLSDSRTSADSVDARGVRSGTAIWRTDLSDISFAHHGMALKCATGSAVGWL